MRLARGGRLQQNARRMEKRFSPLFVPLAAFAGTLVAPAAFGVSVAPHRLPQNAFIIEMKEPHMEFCCRDARKITHISLQKYVSAQPAESARLNSPPQYVTEMTIDFENMPGQIRIYAMSEFDPLRIAEKIPQYGNAKSRAREIVNKATASNAADLAQYLVVKTYPHTTHAKTIEFRVPDSEEVENFYKIFRKHYLRSRSDRKYYGSCVSPNAATNDEKLFIGGEQKGSPRDDWKNSLATGETTSAGGNIEVSGLSGLRFTLGVPDAVSSEIEPRDVNKK